MINPQGLTAAENVTMEISNRAAVHTAPTRQRRKGTGVRSGLKTQPFFWLLTALAAVDICRAGGGDRAPIWNVNTEDEYHEAHETRKGARS